MIWVESICDDEKVVENNIKSAKLNNPDYIGVDPDIVLRKFSCYKMLGYKGFPSKDRPIQKEISRIE